MYIIDLLIIFLISATQVGDKSLALPFFLQNFKSRMINHKVVYLFVIVCKLYIGCSICCSKNENISRPGGTSILGVGGGLATKFASEILVGAPNFTSKNIGDKYPKFCPLNFRYDPKIGIFPQLLCLMVTELPKFFLLSGD